MDSMQAAMIDSAFEQGILVYELDAPAPAVRFAIYDGPDGKLALDEKIQLVHVISRPARGEIRGYYVAHGRLCLRHPARPESWPELDAAMAKRLGIELCGALKLAQEGAQS